ncbi:MAG TPA: barstar family protein [Verrucomicrobiae bacterium]
MAEQRVRIETNKIADWKSFHTVFQEAFGFPDFYGRNMDAWIDCMSYLDDRDAGMTRITVARGEVLELEVANSMDFQKRVPEVFQGFIECAALVNSRRVEEGSAPVLALVLS